MMGQDEVVAGAHELPQLVVPGCVDFFNQGALADLPERYRDRKRYFHNPVATLVRLTADEEAELGRVVASRLAEARGPVQVLCPSRGFSLADVEGGDLWDPEADQAFIDALRAALPPSIPFEDGCEGGLELGQFVEAFVERVGCADHQATLAA